MHFDITTIVYVANIVIHVLGINSICQMLYIKFNVCTLSAMLLPFGML